MKTPYVMFLSVGMNRLLFETLADRVFWNTDELMYVSLYLWSSLRLFLLFLMLFWWFIIGGWRQVWWIEQTPACVWLCWSIKQLINEERILSDRNGVGSDEGWFCFFLFSCFVFCFLHVHNIILIFFSMFITILIAIIL